MISNLKHDIESRREKALELSAQAEKHIAGGGRFSTSPSMPINPNPARRSDKVDPETVLVRKRRSPSPSERAALRRIADSL
ncbi:hypothetical protein [Pseudomonas capsici]|uniref:hypothetical protein n=1 Tax=Pseudomonas capsici TaxID=2810614 RepID=UPI0021F124E7|nr:hypothetical protein [Pseudomonas capsici]MCV4285052.1 hypothetical protein [Pseudomonas capsici]